MPLLRTTLIEKKFYEKQNHILLGRLPEHKLDLLKNNTHLTK